MNIIIIILIIVIIISLLASVYISTFNKLQHYKTRIEISENQIDEALRKKFDIICELNTEIKDVADNKDYLKEFTNLKNQKLTNYDTDRKLIDAVNIVRELKNDYKKLNNDHFNKKFNEIRKIDENLTSAKNFYNKYTSELNTIIRKFPSNIVAKNHKFKIKLYFDNKNMQDAVIDDFKL